VCVVVCLVGGGGGGLACLLKLEQRAKKYPELRGEYVE